MICTRGAHHAILQNISSSRHLARTQGICVLIQGCFHMKTSSIRSVEVQVSWMRIRYSTLTPLIYNLPVAWTQSSPCGSLWLSNIIGSWTMLLTTFGTWYGFWYMLHRLFLIFEISESNTLHTNNGMRFMSWLVKLDIHPCSKPTLNLNLLWPMNRTLTLC